MLETEPLARKIALFGPPTGCKSVDFVRYYHQNHENASAHKVSPKSYEIAPSFVPWDVLLDALGDARPPKTVPNRSQIHRKLPWRPKVPSTLPQGPFYSASPGSQKRPTGIQKAPNEDKVVPKTSPNHHFQHWMHCHPKKSTGSAA